MKLINPANKRKYSVIVVGSGLAGAAAAACGEVVALLQNTLDAIRTTYMALRPFHLDDLGLCAALTWLCRSPPRRRRR